MKSACWDTRATDSIIKSRQKDTEASIPLLQIFITCCTYEIFTNGFQMVFLRSQAIIFGQFWCLKTGKVKRAFCLPREFKTMQISVFFPKYLQCLSLQDDILIYYIAEIFENVCAKM